MFLKIKDTEYELRLPCRNFRRLKEKLGGSLMETITTAMQEGDVDVMAEAFAVLSVSHAITKDAAYDLLDAYMEEDHTVMDFGTKIMEVLDQAGFLPKKGMAATMSKAMRKEMTKAFADLEKSAADEPEAVQEPATEPEFKGYTA